MLWTIRKNLMEILVHAQFSNIELAMSPNTKLRRRYKYLLKPDVAFETACKVVLTLIQGGNNVQ